MISLISVWSNCLWICLHTLRWTLHILKRLHKSNLNVSGGMKTDTDVLHHPVLEISSNVGDSKGMLKQRFSYSMQSKLSMSAIQWGKCNEAIAWQQYTQHLQHQELKVCECGLYISYHGFLAASPDGIVCDKDGSLAGVLEIKCPY